MTLAAIAEALAGKSFRFVSEADLQAGIAQTFKDAAIAHEREVRLGAADRIDFMVGDVGVEVKIGGSLQNLTRQLMRYAKHERVTSLVLVTSQNRLGNLPGTLLGKPLTVVTLSRAFA